MLTRSPAADKASAGSKASGARRPARPHARMLMVPIPAGGEWTLDNFQVEPFAPWLKQMGKVLQKGLGARSRAR